MFAPLEKTDGNEPAVPDVVSATDVSDEFGKIVGLFGQILLIEQTFPQSFEEPWGSALHDGAPGREDR